MLLSADISNGTLDVEICPSKVLFEQTMVDVPSRVKKTPLILFNNWLFMMDMEASPLKVASIAYIVACSIVQEETSRF